ncbi:MAG: glycosyltransferase family 2 protein [Candidatus Methanoperedens sp.]|nr:glycosyltransferase family 2 protein [Candidatus Methanoperedens sp.]
MQLSIVIPAYNEENRIINVISKYFDFYEDFEIIVVCDGKDNTAKIIKELSLKCPKIKLLEFHERLGKGKGIIEGFNVAVGDIIGFIDADGSIEPEDIKSMLSALSNVDGVIASRRLKESKILVKQPIMRRFSSQLFNIIVKLIFWMNFKDTQCGAKFFKNKAIKDILIDMETKGFEFDVELLWRLKKMRYNIIEYPVTWKHSEGSSFSLLNAPIMFSSLLKVRFRY